MTEASHPQPHRHRSVLQSVQSLLPVYSPRQRHSDEEDTIAVPNSGVVREPPSDKTRKKGDLLTTEDKLSLFRSLVGIDNPPGLHVSTLFRSGRAASNEGIYSRVIKAEKKAKRDFKYYSSLISFCVGAQVLVAACLTALGAGNASHRAVTAFGALNTVLAGFMAYFKGSGLPNRIKYYKNEWTKLREYIEQRERDFCREHCVLDVETEVITIEAMYEEVKSDIEANTPDSFISVRDISKKGGINNPGPGLARGAGLVVDAAADRVQDRVGDAATKSAASLKRNLSYQSSQFGEKVAGYGDKVSGTVAGYGEKATGYGNQAQGTVSSYGEKLMGYGNQAQGTVSGYGEKLAGFGDRVSSYGERIASSADKPVNIGVTIERPQSEQPMPKDPPKDRDHGDHST